MAVTELEGMPSGVPLCVDLDGTLVRTDMLHETTLQLLKAAPFELARFPGWLARGKAWLKHSIAARLALDVAHLPYRPEVLALIKEARAARRPVVLATAAAPQIAKAIADHLGLFDRIISSDDRVNLSAERKAGRLVAEFGKGGFDYIGNSTDDLPVWRHARFAIVVSRSGRLRTRAMKHGCPVQQVRDADAGLSPWLRCLRPHQWLKNLLVFLPLIAAHRFDDPVAVAAAVLGFVAFSMAASFGYLVNDLLDLNADRRHVRKRFRPFAAGALPIAGGIALAGVLLAGAMTIALLLPRLFAPVLLAYVCLTLAYSLRLKRQVVVDVILLAGLYTLRIVAGAMSVSVVLSFWLLAFSMFVFLSLALVKRYSELRLATEGRETLAGRGYRSTDLPVLMAQGTGSGLMAVMVLALYIDSPVVSASYRAPVWLWLAPPVMLYWMTRLWMKAHRGEVHDDPVVFAALDRQSQIVAVILCGVFSAAVAGWRFW